MTCPTRTAMRTRRKMKIRYPYIMRNRNDSWLEMVLRLVLHPIPPRSSRSKRNQTRASLRFRSPLNPN
jgi:hypothetical protein